MPQEGIDFVPRSDLLSYEEMIRLATILKSLGIKKIRITGGEPFVRKDLGMLLRALRTVVGIESLHITTNGTLLDQHMDLLREVNMNSVNVSLDSLDAEQFYHITRRNDFEKVWNAVLALLKSGIRTNVNMVVQKHFNANEIIAFSELTTHYPLNVRFIEAMPFDGSAVLDNSQVMSSVDILNEIKISFPQLEQLDQGIKSSSVNYRIPGAQGKIGIIPALSRSLCGTCNRLRLTATGDLKTCLYADSFINMKRILSQNPTDDDIRAVFLLAASQKAENGFKAEESRAHQLISESMASIGG
jgi:cyclic pyranopterin phosphate synthase